MRLEFKKIGGFLLGFPGWILEDDKVIYKNTEFYIDKMYNIQNMLSPASYHNISFHYDGNESFHYDGKKNLVCLHYDRDDESKNNGIEAYKYILKLNGNKQRYVFDYSSDECIVDNEGIIYNGEKIPYSSLTKFEENLLSINGSDGSFTTEYNNSKIEIKYKGNDKFYAKEAIKLANAMIKNYNQYHNDDRAKEIISRAIEENNNPRDFTKRLVTKYIGLEEQIDNLIDKYQDNVSKIVLDNNNDEKKSIEKFKDQFGVNDEISSYFVKDYIKRIEQVSKKLEKDNKIDFAKDYLVDNDGDKFATIKEIKSKFKCNTDDATEIVNEALKFFETKETTHKIRNSSINYTNNTSKRSPSSNTPKCPHCSSTNFRRISTAGKIVSTGVFGLASSTIGKTFVCNKCGYKW